MATTYLTPGVYVEEIPAQNKPIEGVSTSTAAFIGLAPGGPVNRAIRVSNWSQFARTFSDPAAPDNGPFMEGAYLAHSVYGFFQNGGQMCWIVRVGAAENGARKAIAALPSAADGSAETLRAVARKEIEGPVKVEVSQEEGGDGGESTYKLVITAGSETETFENLTVKKGRTNIATKVNASSKLIQIEETGASLPDVAKAPAPGTYTLVVAQETVGELSSEDFEGDAAKREGTGGLVAIDEVSIVCAPDMVHLAQNGDDRLMRDAQDKLIAHCETLGDRVCILDPPPGLIPQEIEEWRKNTAGYDSKMATMYWPWIETTDPLTRNAIMIPPSGHMAGVWARTDSERGVHKAPANEVVRGCTGLAFDITSAEQGSLNRAGINCIRAFSGRGIRIWGARTLSSDPEWRYLNVRRLFNYVSQSLLEGTQWSVFEPNDEKLWLRLRASVENFLTNTWRSGALFGATPSQAFFVKCDSETNPPDVIELGQVVVEVGIAPVKPAEFVIFRLSQFVPGAEGGGDGGE
jgi:phage tail sheath protein FI